MSGTKDVTITRKIELNLHGYESKDFKEAFDKLYKWRNICFNAANLVATHCFHQEQTKQFFYYTEKTKVKLADVNTEKGKDDGILTTSKLNTTYQLLSSIYKGQIPTSILTSLNSQIVSSFNKEKKHYFSGERSLRNYKSDIPIPIRTQDISQMKEGEHGNYEFSLYKISFRTNFGKDLSGNKIIFERYLQGEYKLCDSSIQVVKKNGKSRIFLLAVFQFDKLRVNVDPKKVGTVKLDFETPMILTIGDKTIKIGSKQEFLHRRLAIQAGLRRAQIASKYNKGGKGIQKKIAAIERYKESEISYVSSRIHKYSAELINLCIKYKIGTLVLDNMKEVIEKTKEENNEFLLRNWSYFGLREKISYKSNKFGILLQDN